MMSPLPDGYAAALKGANMREADAVRLEAELRDDPDDFEKRARLLGYYFSNSCPKTAEARRRHVMWVITQHPESELAGSPFAQQVFSYEHEGYEEARCAWLELAAANPENPVILGNAADFLEFGNPEEAEALLKQGQAMDPDNPEWATRLEALAARRRRPRSNFRLQPATPSALSEGCRRFHQKLVAGRCPFCKRVIIEGRLYDAPPSW